MGDQEAYNEAIKLYAELPADKQAEIKAVFGTDDVVGNFQTAGMFITENEEESEVLRETIEKLKQVMATCPNVKQTKLGAVQHE